MATYVYASSQGQLMHSARTNINYIYQTVISLLYNPPQIFGLHQCHVIRCYQSHGYFLPTSSSTGCSTLYMILGTEHFNLILVRAECVRCPWALLRNEVSTIFGIIFLFSATYFSPIRGYCRVPKFCMGF